jgi:DNA-directed RNA polymerase subunit K/omega
MSDESDVEPEIDTGEEIGPIGEEKLLAAAISAPEPSPAEIVYRFIPNEERQTSDKLTDYEKTAAIVQRISQISRGSQIFTDADGLDSTTKIAQKELRDKRSPLIVMRECGRRLEEGKMIVFVEQWSINELTDLQAEIQ